MTNRNDPRAGKVAVVGAGPAGMMAALAAAEGGARAMVFERLRHPGAKLLASGGGRCNLTNTLPAEEFMACFGRQGRFMQPALAALDATALRALLQTLGVLTGAPDGVHVYPTSNKAAAVQEALLQRCGELGVDFRLGVEVDAVRVQGGRVVGLATSDGPIEAPKVILAVGGRGYPELGGGQAGMALAAAAGHQIAEPTPALVPLITAEHWPGTLAGVSIPAEIRIDLRGQSARGVCGDVLFTHHGLSGPAILDVSGDVASLLTKHPTVLLRLRFCPEIAAGQWVQWMEEWRCSRGKKRVHNLVAENLPAALAHTLCREAKLPVEAQAAHLTAAQRESLTEMLTGAPLSVIRTEGWERAMVTRGGVSLKEIDPKTLQSRVVHGLYFAGEVVDLDGPSGGFNLQWAFSSGHLAGRAATEPLR